MVGLTPEELESVKDFIKMDHVYYKTCDDVQDVREWRPILPRPAEEMMRELPLPKDHFEREESPSLSLANDILDSDIADLLSDCGYHSASPIDTASLGETDDLWAQPLFSDLL